MSQMLLLLQQGLMGAVSWARAADAAIDTPQSKKVLELLEKALVEVAVLIAQHEGRA